jgi:hypothetical protein
MKRSWIFAGLGIAALATALAGRAPADTIAYSFAALPGPVSNCQFFNDNLNDHSETAIVRLTDLIYNRAALPPGATVSVSQTAMSARGDQLVQFDLHGRLLCAGAAALHPEITEALPTPP